MNEAESFSAPQEYLEVMVDSSSLDKLRNSDFGNGLTMDVNDIQGSILSLDYGEGGDEAFMPADEAEKDYMNQIGITTYDFDDDNVDDEDDWNTDKRVWRGTVNFPEGKQGEGGEFYASVIGFTKDDENTYEKQIMNHILNTVRLMPVRYRDDEDNQFYYAESFSADTVTVNCHKCDASMEVEAWKHNKKNPITGQRLNIRHLCAKCSPQPQGLITYGAESFSADEEEIFRHKQQIIAKMMRDAPACESCGNLKTYTPTEYNRYTCWSCKDDPSWGAETFNVDDRLKDDGYYYNSQNQKVCSECWDYDDDSFEGVVLEETTFHGKKQLTCPDCEDIISKESAALLYSPHHDYDWRENYEKEYQREYQSRLGAESFEAEKGYRNYGGERWDFITRILVRDEVDEVQNGMNRTQSLKRYPSNSGGPKWLRVKRTKEWPGNGRNEYYYYWGLINPEWLKARKKAESFGAEEQGKKTKDEIIRYLLRNCNDEEDYSDPIYHTVNDKNWTIADLFIRQKLNNGCDGFGMENVHKVYDYLVDNKEQLIEYNLVSKDGINNSGFPLWANYDFEAESFSADEYNFQLVFSTYNRNSQSCIKSKDYGGGICGLKDRYGNRRGSYGSSGMSEPTCPHCKKVWNNMSNQDKGAWIKKAESFSAESQTRFYRNLGVGAALVAGLVYWIKR